MTSPAHVVTDRLVLRAVGPADLDVMHALHCDPEVWRHFPQGRHRDLERTRTSLDFMAQGWAIDGLGYWIVSASDDPAAVIGIGGVTRVHDAAWNLYYRFFPSAWGHGFAGEVAAAALAAAALADPGAPVVASLLEHNHASRRVAERAGLIEAFRGPDSASDPDGPVRLIFSDRPLDGTVLTMLTHR